MSTEPKSYDPPVKSIQQLETRLRNLIKSDQQEDELFARLRQEIVNIVISQVLAGVTDDEGKPIFMVKGGVAMSFLMGLRSRPTKDFDIACRIDRDEGYERLVDALADGWSGFQFRIKGEPTDIRDTGAKRFEVQTLLAGQTFKTVQLELAKSEGETGQEFELLDNKLLELERLGLEQPDKIVLVTIAYLVAQKLHACTDHSDEDRINDRSRDLIDLQLVDRAFADDRNELVRMARACREIFGLRNKHSWPPEITILPGWEESYRRDAERMGFEPTDVADAKRAVDDFIRRIDEVPEDEEPTA